MNVDNMNWMSYLAAFVATGIGLGAWSACAAPSVAHSTGIGINTGVSSCDDACTVGFETELRYMTSFADACDKTFKSTPPTGFTVIIR